MGLGLFPNHHGYGFLSGAEACSSRSQDDREALSGRRDILPEKHPGAHAVRWPRNPQDKGKVWEDMKTIKKELFSL
jgi:hypothetical protein